jgi:hypothetical protein
MHQFMRTSFFTLVALLAVGCGGSLETTLGSEQNPRVRVFNLVEAPAQVDITFDGNLVANDARFGTLTGYEIYRNGNRRTLVRDAASQGQLADTDYLYELSNFYTNVVFNDGPSVSVARVQEDRAVPSGQGQLRLINLSSDNRLVDVYVTAPAADINAITPTRSNVSFGASSTSVDTYTQFVPAQYLIRVTPPGSKTVLVSETLVLNEQASLSLYLTSQNDVLDIRVLNDKL